MTIPKRTAVTESIPLPKDVLACPKDSFAVTGWVKLRDWAQWLAARYNGPVYLVGSSLKSGKPRDIDIRVVVEDVEFSGRYGIHPNTDLSKLNGWPNQHWIDDMAKRNAELASAHRLNSDFQVYPKSYCVKFEDEPRVRLAAPSGWYST